MIRCYPVDGSGSFEVEDEERVIRCTRLGKPDEDTMFRDTARYWATNPGTTHVTRIARGRLVRVESWRERAERLERGIDAAGIAICARIESLREEARCFTNEERWDERSGTIARVRELERALGELRNGKTQP